MNTPAFPPVGFRCAVSKHGYSWQGKLLVSNFTAEPRIGQHTFFDVPPGLFAKFAALPVKDWEAYLDFANKYGWLYNYAAGQETKRSWLRLHRQLSVAVSLWRAICDQNQDEIRKILAIPELCNLGDNKHYPRPKELPIIEHGYQVLGQMITHAQSPNGAYIVWVLRDSVEQRTWWRLNPASLAGAMWMQFTGLVVTNTALRFCSTCGEFIDTSGGADRIDKDYCGDACRSKAYRARKKQAKAMRAEGTRLNDIAKHFGSDVATVKRWLGEK